MMDAEFFFPAKEQRVFFCENPSRRMCRVKLTRKSYAIKAVLCRSLFDPFFVAHFACFQSAIVCVFPVGGLIPLFFIFPSLSPIDRTCLQSKQTLHNPQSCPPSPPNACDGLPFYAMPNGVDQKESWSRSLCVLFWERTTKNIGFMFMFPSAQMQLMTWENPFFVCICVWGAWRAATKGSVSPQP